MKNFFTFSRNDKIGVATLSCLIVVLTVWSKNKYSHNLPDPFDVDTSKLEYVSYGEQGSDNSDNYQNFYSKTDYNKNYTLHVFDPNILDNNGWQLLGFSKKQAASIIKYRTNFGPFKQKEDLKKVYIISDKKYNELEPYIDITEVRENNQVALININLATAEELQKIKGIGVVYSKRIVEYRSLLGGYHQLEQLYEVYGLSDEAISAIDENVDFKSNNLTLIKINKAPKAELKKHPYINFEITSAILKERELRRIENLDFLEKMNLINNKEKNKLEPYINYKQ